MLIQNENQAFILFLNFRAYITVFPKTKNFEISN